MAKITNQWGFAQVGEFMIENNWWNGPSTYQQSVEYDPANLMTTGITFNWSGMGTGTQVNAFPEIWFGYNVSWNVNSGWGSLDYSSQLSDLKTFNVSYDITIEPGSQFLDVAFDIWLTSSEYGDKSTVMDEIMIWLDTPSTTMAWGNYVADYVYQGHTAKIYNEVASSSTGQGSWEYIAIVFDEAYLKGSVDLKHVMNALIAEGLVTSDEYIGGFELGTEVTSGSGSVNIKGVSVDFEKDTTNPPPVGEEVGHSFIGDYKKNSFVGTAYDDVLDGRNGHDILTGGLGSDEFIFRSTKGKHSDHVVDFEHGVDQISLRATMFGMKEGDLNESRLVFDGEWTNGSRFMYSNDTGKLFYDEDGKRHGHDRVLIAKFDNHEAIDASDIFLF